MSLRCFRLLFLLLSGLPCARLAHADVDIRVGLGAGCDTSSIQAAIAIANNANGISNIRIASNQAYTEQALTIDGKNVRLVGGYANCTDTVGGSVTYINGAGGATKSILDIKGSTTTVAIHNLRFLGGDELIDAASYGGAVDILEGPHAFIYFENNWFASSQAGWGGGISIRNPDSANPANVYVRLGPNNIITNNRAYRGGGGIFCRDAVLDIVGAGTSISSNYAGDDIGDGGGLFLSNCRAKLAGGNDGGVVSNNTAARNGGGIYMVNDLTRLHVYTIDPDHPTRIRGNQAGGNGGGLDLEEGPRAYLWDVVVEENVARGGGGAVALYLEDQYSDRTELLAFKRLTGTDRFGHVYGAPVEAVNCRQPEPCNLFRANIAETATGALRDGAAIRVSADLCVICAVQNRAAVELHSAKLAGHRGANLLFAKSWEDDALAGVHAYGSLMTSNEVGGNLIHVDGDDAYAQLHHVTIAGNTIGGAGVLRFEDDPSSSNQSEDNRVLSSIVWQPGKLFFVNTPLVVEARYNVANELSQVPAGERPFNRDFNPLFVNAAAGDYRVLAAGPAADYAPFTVPQTRDGLPRPIDLSGVPDGYGTADAGAYEIPPDDRIFASGFDSP